MSEINRREKDFAQENANRIVKAIFESDKRIRYCAVIGEKGEELVGGIRPGIKSLEPGIGSAKLRMQSLIGLGMTQSWNKLHGDADYMIAHRDRVMFFIFPLSSIRLLLASVEPDYPLSEFPKVLDIVSGLRKKNH